MANNRFRRGPNDQRLFQFLAAADRDHRQLRRKSLDMRFLALNKALRNQKWKGGIQMPGGFESPVQHQSDVFPKRPTVRPHNHAAADRRVIRQLRPQNELVVPLRKIFSTRRKFLVRHAYAQSLLNSSIESNEVMKRHK